MQSPKNNRKILYSPINGITYWNIPPIIEPVPSIIDVMVPHVLKIFPLIIWFDISIPINPFNT